MALVRLRAPLKELAGGRTDHQVDGTTVVELLASLERAHPAMTGWMLDEQRRVREHINVFVNGELAREDTVVAEGDRVHVLPSISGG
jgi:molybdopterin converting factor small subunit